MSTGSRMSEETGLWAYLWGIFLIRLNELGRPKLWHHVGDVSWEWALVTVCFRSEDTVRPAASCSCCHAFFIVIEGIAPNCESTPDVFLLLVRHLNKEIYGQKEKYSSFRYYLNSFSSIKKIASSLKDVTRKFTSIWK